MQFLCRSTWPWSQDAPCIVGASRVTAWPFRNAQYNDETQGRVARRKFNHFPWGLEFVLGRCRG